MIRKNPKTFVISIFNLTIFMQIGKSGAVLKLEHKLSPLVESRDSGGPTNFGAISTANKLLHMDMLSIQRDITTLS